MTFCGARRLKICLVNLICVVMISWLIYRYFQSQPKLFYEELTETKLGVNLKTLPPSSSDDVSSRRGQSIVIQPSEPCLVQTRTRRSAEDGVWYNFTSSSFQFYAYTAFLDDRPSLLSPPIVRIIAISTILKVKGGEDKPRLPVALFCRLHYEGQAESRLVQMETDPKSIATSSFLKRLNKELVNMYIFSCPLSNSSSIPVSVSVVRGHLEDRTQVTVTSCMPVELPSKPTNLRDFAICVPVTYGTKLSPFRLIEWLEMQRLLGVSLVGIHCMDNVTDPVLGVLRSYAEEGFVDLRFSTHIPDPGKSPDHRRLHSTPAVNDCMYRHMYSFRYMLVIDFDELILPDSFSNLRELVDFLNRNTSRTKPVNYEFRNSYFFLDLPPVPLNDEEGTMSNLTLVKYRTKVRVSPRGFAIKSIINPQACAHMHHHYCLGVTTGFQSRPMYSEVDSSIATNRHYKRCSLGSRRCTQMMRNVTRDDVMLRFAPQLQQLVNEKISTTFEYLSRA